MHLNNASLVITWLLMDNGYTKTKVIIPHCVTTLSLIYTTGSKNKNNLKLIIHRHYPPHHAPCPRAHCVSLCALHCASLDGHLQYR